jgi:hypothetical protein
VFIQHEHGTSPGGPPYSYGFRPGRGCHDAIVAIHTTASGRSAKRLWALVGSNLPYAGYEKPELAAWVRLAEDDRPPDLYRMIMLIDALAPSYAAILTTLQPIPTVELTVTPSYQLGVASSPWVLLRAATTSATPDGWLHEHIDAFDVGGAYLAGADQLRTIASTGKAGRTGKGGSVPGGEQ